MLKMKKTKKELSDLELTAMLIQYLVEIDEFPDAWKDFETPEERLRLKQEFWERVQKNLI